MVLWQRLVLALAAGIVLAIITAVLERRSTERRRARPQLESGLRLPVHRQRCPAAAQAAA